MSMTTLAVVAESVGGRLFGPDRSFDSVSTDSRTVEPGQLFFALRGERFDGASYVADAARRGAVGAVVSARQPEELPQVEVANPQRALGVFAKAWRERFELPVIGITGSNGKTTVKEMTAAIMRASAGGDHDRVLVTWGNLNNEIGVPVTVLYLNATHLSAVVEMGAAAPGDIAYLADIARPTIAVVTNAYRAHLKGFGNIERVAATKGEIYASLQPDGTAIVNRDDRFFSTWWELSAGRRRVSFGSHPDADYRVTEVRQSAGRDGVELSFTMRTPAGPIAALLPMAGQHNVINALAAAAAGMAAGASRDAVAVGLREMRNVTGRLRRVPAPGGITVYDDTYNANPGSVRAAVEFLASQSGERWLVLGDMAELGPQSAELHGEVGDLARRSGISRLFCTGVDARAAATAFGAGAEWRESMDDLIEILRAALRQGTTVLVKGSRRMGMERVVQAISVRDGAAGREA